MLRIISSILVLVAGGVLFWQWPNIAGSSANLSPVSDTDKAAQTQSERTKIWLMTSLPIVWGDNGSMNNILSGKAKPAAIYRHWKSRYDIEAVDSFETLEEANIDIIILAQPKAMDPADIAALDAWVRSGGRVLILTDPMLVWPSELPLGDNRRPLASGLLSPLLDYWGLELQMPDDKSAGSVEMGFGDYSVTTAGVGNLVLRDKKSPDSVACAILDKNIVAKCEIGKGRAVIVADADFLHEDLWGADANNAGALKWTEKILSELQYE